MTRGTLRGAAAGAAGTTALHVASGVDALWRGRPPSRAPEQLVERLAERAGIAVPGGRGLRRHRITALGPLAGALTGVAIGAVAGALRAAGLRLPTVVGGPLLGAAAMATTDAALAWTGVSNPRSWSIADWAADAVPHLVYGVTTHRTLAALDDSPAPPTPSPGTLARAAAIGAATGCRSTAGLAALALTTTRGEGGPVVSRLGSGPATVVVGTLAAGELLADKAPIAPSRLAPSGLVPRMMLGAATAAGVARREGDVPGPAVTLAVVAAVGRAVLGTRLRAAAAQRFGTDRPGALIEDAVAGTLAWLGARRGRSATAPTTV